MFNFNQRIIGVPNFDLYPYGIWVCLNILDYDKLSVSLFKQRFLFGRIDGLFRWVCSVALSENMSTPNVAVLGSI